MRVKQVLINLLSNAIKYNVKNGTITLSVAKQSDNLLRINVCDTGPGIAKEKQKLLFKPFVRLREPGDYVEGAGIGLALSKNLIEMMNGRMGVISNEGDGSCFWFELQLVV